MQFFPFKSNVDKANSQVYGQNDGIEINRKNAYKASQTMQMTSRIIFGLALFAYALTRVPDKYGPTWIHRLDSWQTLIGIVAIIMAMLIVMNPEFYALGILGDSAFFDLLVLAISCQLQMFGSRAWGYFNAGSSNIIGLARWRLSVTCSVLLLTFAYMVSAIQKVVHRLSC